MRNLSKALAHLEAQRAELQRDLTRIEQAITALTGGTSAPRKGRQGRVSQKGSAEPGKQAGRRPRKRRPMSPETIAKMKEAQRLRREKERATSASSDSGSPE